jgi:hypothetical protein
MATAKTLFNDFVDAADSSGNIKNSREILNYLSTLATTVVRIGDTKFKALYPMVGGSAFSHKFNFMNPVDSDAAFRLTFSGTFTHSSMGVKGDGSTGYAETYLNPSTHLVDGDAHLSFYATDNVVNSNAWEMGGAIGSNYFGLIVRYAGNTAYGIFSNSTGVDYYEYPSLTSAGYSISSIKSGVITFVKGGLALQSSTPLSTGTTFPNMTIPLFCNLGVTGGGVRGNYSTKRSGLISIGSGLTTAESTYLSHQVRFIQGILGRQ